MRVMDPCNPDQLEITTMSDHNSLANAKASPQYLPHPAQASQLGIATLASMMKWTS